MSVDGELRRALLARAGFRCEMPGVRDHSSGLDFSHRLARSRGGMDALWNGCALCRRCHMWCEEHPSAAEGLVSRVSGVTLRVPGYVLRGVYVGADEVFGALVDEWRRRQGQA